MTDTATLLDVSGNPMKSSYDGAGYSAGNMRHWRVPFGGSADSDLLPELPTLQARGRDLERNTGIASGFTQTYTDNVVGPRLKLTAMPNWRAIGRDAQWIEDNAEEWAANTEAHWRPYADSKMFDLERNQNFHGMAAMVLAGKLSAGGAAVIPRWKPRRPGTRYSTCFQIIDIDRVCNPDGKPDTARLRDGIEYDRDGVATAYWIRSSSDPHYNGVYTPHSWERVPAFTRWGRRRFLHCYQAKRPGQSKGAPKLTPVLSEIKGLSRFRRAHLDKAVAQALMTLFVKSNLAPDVVAAMFSQSDTSYMEAREKLSGLARTDLNRAKMGDSLIIPLAPGDDVVNPQATSPNEVYSPYVRFAMREVCSALNVSYETIMHDFSDTNYASARAAMLLDWKTFTGELNWLSLDFSNIVYGLWLEEAIDKGDVEGDGFRSYRDAWSVCRWTGAGRGHIDAVKETKAASERLSNGTSTLDREASEQGADWQDVQDQRAVEVARAFRIAEERKLPEIAGYILAGAPIPGQFNLQSPIDPKNGPGAVTQTEEDKAENEGIAEGREAAAETVEDEAA